MSTIIHYSTQWQCIPLFMEFQKPYWQIRTVFAHQFLVQVRPARSMNRQWLIRILILQNRTRTKRFIIHLLLWRKILFSINSLQKLPSPGDFIKSILESFPTSLTEWELRWQISQICFSSFDRSPTESTNEYFLYRGLLKGKLNRHFHS